MLALAGLADAAEPGAEHAADAFFSTSTAIFAALGDAAALAAERLAALLASAPGFPAAIAGLFARLVAEGFDAWALAGWSALFLGLGAAVELAVRWVMGQLAGPGPAAGRIGLAARLLRIGADFLGLGVFAVAGGWPLLMVVRDQPAAQTVAMAYLAAILLVRGFAVLLRASLAPFRPGYRVVALQDAAAGRLYWHALGLAGFAAFAHVTASLLHSGEAGVEATLLFVLVARSLLAAGVVAACFANCDGIAEIIRHAPDGSARGRGWRSFARVWHLLAALYVAFSWSGASTLLLLGYWDANTMAILSFVAVLAATGACMAVDDWAARLDARMRDPAEPDLPGYARFLARIGKATVILATLLVLLRIWGVPWLGLAREQLSPAVLQALSQLLVTIGIAYALWNLVLIGTERTLRRVAGAAEDGATARATRATTLLPLVRNVLLGAILVIGVMIGLSSIGVDVVPLFAGAGVIGLAVGLGSQTLVKDVVSGLFFLLDDAFRLGEYVDLGAAKGTIERVSIRSLQVRHQLGALHTVPFGEIKTIANMSRGWAVMRMEFRVPFEVDTAELRRKFKVLGKQLAADPETGHLFLEPLKSQGVVAIDESAQIVRAKFTCPPGEQFTLRRIVYDAIREMFRREGIDVAVREVRVRAQSLPGGIGPDGPARTPSIEDAEALAEIAAAAQPPATG